MSSAPNPVRQHVSRLLRFSPRIAQCKRSIYSLASSFGQAFVHVQGHNHASASAQPHWQSAKKHDLSTATMSNTFSINVIRSVNYDTCSIKRSYPKGKPEKLVAGLERLLAHQQWNPETRTYQPKPDRWLLSKDGDAIHRALFFDTEDEINCLIQTIAQGAENLNHHPHHSHKRVAGSSDGNSRWAFAATCTTHVPHGLSLKDVQLADCIDDAIRQVRQNSLDLDAGLVVDLDDVELRELTENNEDVARKALENPDSLCATGG